MLNRRIQLMVADDHPIIHAGLNDLLRDSAQIDIVGRPTSFAEVLDQLARTTVDILVLDLLGMGKAGLTMLRRLHWDYPHLPVLIFSSSVDLAHELLQAGARGYVVKEELNDHLTSAIQAVVAGQRFVSPMVQEYLDRTAYLRDLSRLRPQEISVLQLLASGLGTTQIAAALDIDSRSAQNYITRLRRKTGCTERTQLVAWYQRWYRGGGSSA